MSTEGVDDSPTPAFDVVLGDLIAQADMTVPEVAKATGLDDQTIRTYLSGTRRPRLTSVRKLEAALNDVDFSMRKALSIDVPKSREREALIGDVLAERRESTASISQLTARLDRVEAAMERLLRERGIDPREYLIGPSAYELALIAKAEGARDAQRSAARTLSRIARTKSDDDLAELELERMAAMGGETEIHEEAEATRPSGVPEGLDE